MKTKICTSLEQSKKLVELGLSGVNTADMYYYNLGYTQVPRVIHSDHDRELVKCCLPAWSLSRLLVIIRDYQCVWLGANDVASWVTEFNLGSGKHYATDPTTDPLDAAYNCLVWLIENGKIDPKEITI